MREAGCAAQVLRAKSGLGRRAAGTAGILRVQLELRTGTSLAAADRTNVAEPRSANNQFQNVVALTETTKVLLTHSFRVNILALDAMVQSKRGAGACAASMKSRPKCEPGAATLDTQLRRLSQLSTLIVVRTSLATEGSAYPAPCSTAPSRSAATSESTTRVTDWHACTPNRSAVWLKIGAKSATF